MRNLLNKNRALSSVGSVNEEDSSGLESDDESSLNSDDMKELTEELMSRLQTEMRVVKERYSKQFTLVVVDRLQWNITFKGPLDEPYNGAFMTLQIVFPADYP